MNKKLAYTIIGVLVVFCLGIIIYNISGNYSARRQLAIAAPNEDGSLKDNIITVAGTGKIAIKPDVAYIDVGVESFDKDAKKAQQDNKQTMTKVIQKLKDYKIDDKDMQTSNYNVNVDVDYQNNKRVILGYRVLNTVKVRVRDIDKIGDILNGVYGVGANNSYGICFDVINRDEAYKKAMDKALDDAKAKAESLAKHAGVKLGGAIAIHEGGVPQTYKEMSLGSYDTMAVKADAGVPVSVGEMEISAGVTVVYSYK